MNKYRFLYLVLLLTLCCCSEKRYYSANASELNFSDDTIHFDTVFTSIGSTTRELRLINPYKEWIVIDRINLAGGVSSPFRLNVDGVPSITHTDIEIAPKDSIFIFIDVIIDPNNDSSPVVIADSIEFLFNNNLLIIDLIAWGQDINLINGEVIGTETWTAGKPYVVYNSMLVDTGEILMIEAGVDVLFHRSSTMYIAGSLIVNGSDENPVSFRSDRLEEVYFDIPGQWGGLYFLNGSSANYIMNANIEMAVSGIHLGNLGSPDDPPDIILKNLRIQHMSVSGISSIGATINAENCVISHCGAYCLFLTAGGDYSFLHNTIANQWDYSYRATPSVLITDYYDYDEIRYTGILNSGSFRNTVITGNNTDELVILSDNDEILSASFENCLIKADTDAGSLLAGYSFTDCIVNLDPLFFNPAEYDFRPDTLSPLINMGSPIYAAIAPFDFRGNSRQLDIAPDIGAYEKQAGENYEKGRN